MSLFCSNLVVEYAGAGQVVRPVDGLSMEVRRGELALLLGASGCGKTSVLSAIASILQPAHGSIALEGVDVTRLSGARLTEYRRTMVGVVFQSFNLVPSLSAAENVQVPLRAAGVNPRRARRRADELLLRVGMAGRRAHKPGSLSGGEQQRVSIARALALDPPLLVADEPTAHLDQARVDDVIQLFREIADEGRIVVVATHDERFMAAADRVVRLTANGREEPSNAQDLRLVEPVYGFRPAQPSPAREHLHARRSSSSAIAAAVAARLPVAPAPSPSRGYVR